QSQNTSDKSDKSHQTYTKTNSKTGEVYSGRTSGKGTAEENVAARDANHHMDEKGFGEAQLDKSSTNADAIRGREQQLIQQNGGAQSQVRHLRQCNKWSKPNKIRKPTSTRKLQNRNLVLKRTDLDDYPTTVLAMVHSARNRTI